MSNQTKRIDELTVRTSLDGTEIFPAVHSLSPTSVSTVGITTSVFSQYIVTTMTSAIDAAVSTGIVAGDFVTSASAVAAFQPIGDYITSSSISANIDARDYVTSANIASTYQVIGDYATSAEVVSAIAEFVTSASLATLYQPVGDYATSAEVVAAVAEFLTSASLASAYQPIGDYATSAEVVSAIAEFVTSVSIDALLSSYLTEASADTKYQLTGDYVTSASLAALYQPIGDYATSAEVVAAIAEFVTSASLAALYQPAGDYPTSASVSAMIASAVPTKYESLGNTITTGGTLSWNHGLGDIPRKISVYLQCVSAVNNYSVGDIIVAPREEHVGVATLYNYVINSINSVSVTLTFSAVSPAFIIVNTSTKTWVAAPNTAWELNFYAET